MKKYYTIYKITNHINNKIYIGKHETYNLDDDYFGSGKYLKRAISMHGIENFTKDILFIFDNKEEMNNKEANLVNEDFIVRNDTYNLCIGGKGGFSYINEQKLNLYGSNGYGHRGSQNLLSGTEMINRLKEKGTYHEYIAKLSKSRLNNKNWLGKSHTDETKAKIGAANSKIQSGKGNSQYGTKWIHNLDLKKSKRIKKENQVPEGWLLGRKIKNIS